MAENLPFGVDSETDLYLVFVAITCIIGGIISNILFFLWRKKRTMITDTIDSNDGVLYRFHRNSDYSGCTIITVPAEDIEGGVGTTKLVTIPFEVLRSYVQSYQRYKMIKEIEDMSDDDFDRYQTMQCRNDD